MLPTGHTDKYMWLFKDNPLSLELPKISPAKIKAVEKADFLSASGKLELLGLLLHNRFTGEIKAKADENLSGLLDKLGLFWFINSYRHSKKGLLKWVQVSANEQINQFIKKHSRTMSPIEAGVLYNYPIPDILAFMNLINRKTKHPKTPVGWYFGKVHSKDAYNQSYLEYNSRWQLIKKTSPKIYQELLKHYRDKLSKRKLLNLELDKHC